MINRLLFYNIEQPYSMICLSLKSTNMKTYNKILPKTAVLPLILFIVFGFADVVLGRAPNEYPTEKIRINPEFKVNRNSNGSVVVTSVSPGKKATRHEFTDLYADILLAANRKMDIELMNNLLQKKYYLSEDDCRREVKHAINVLAEWRIIIREDNIAQH